jgi:putative oxidoreductase
MKPLIELAFRIFNTSTASLVSPFLLLVRLYWGWQFAVTGWGKVNNLDKVTGFFTSLGIPFPALNAQFVAGVELTGGILLMLGLATRATGFTLTINMLVAYITADWEAFSSFLADPDKFVAATPFPFLWASLMSLIFGGGRFSADSFLPAKWFGSGAPETDAPVDTLARSAASRAI